MPQSRVIICPTDLSPGADSALGYAAEIAVARNLLLLVVYWCERGPQSPAHDVAAPQGPIGLFEESVALNISPSLIGALQWEGLVVEGPSAAEAIVDVAAERGAELIVIASRRRPLRAALLGSTAEAVCRTAPCPVLITHPTDSKLATPWEFKRILVAYDFWDDAEIALQHALAIAAEHDAEVHLLYAIPPPEIDAPEVVWAPIAAESHFHCVARRLRSAAPQAVSLGVTVRSHVVTGQPYREILVFAEAEGIDLICMGARGRDNGARSLFGSNSDRVLRQAPCPVLLTRPLKPSLDERSLHVETVGDPHH